MLSMSLDMIQYDCPYIDTTADYEISFFAKQWDFNPSDNKLETRIMVNAADPVELDRGLDYLRDHPNMYNVELLRRKGDKAMIRSHIGETEAMRAIRENNGYITGPFEIEDGHEIWRVGFDHGEVADRALSELGRDNEYEVVSRESVDLEEYYDVMQHVDVAGKFLEECRDLTDVERDTLVKAVNEGYFTRPREATLSTLADEFDISKTAVSKNLRRSQRKILSRVVDAIETVDTSNTYEPDRL
jgi:predicted DNA binding protein